MKKTATVKFLFFLSLIVVTPNFAAAKDDFLDSSLKIAEARNRKILAAADQIKLSKTKLFVSGRAFFPSLQFQTKKTKGRTINSDYLAEELALRGSQPLFEGGRLRASYKHDSLASISAGYNYTKTREELFASVKLAYYELLALKMEYRALTDAFDDIEKLHNKILSEFKAKAISELDVIESENFRDKLGDRLLTTKADMELAEKKLLLAVNVETIENIPFPMPDNIPEEISQLSFTLDQCSDFARLNNIDLLAAEIQIRMSREKQISVRARNLPNFALEGSYGQGGEAFITQPLELSTMWSVLGRATLGLWGNSFELSGSNEKTEPKLVTDVSARIDNEVTEAKIGILDDTNYLVQKKETAVGFSQAHSDFIETLNKILIEAHKNYNDYESSRRDARTYRNEITWRKRKLAFMKKRNDLYEIPTVQLMEESWKYAEAISFYAKSLFKNYSAITELERLTLVNLK